MYGFVEAKKHVYRDDILALTSQESIFKLCFEEIVLDKVRTYTAPYREDHKGDCYFEMGRNGMLHFVDFADPGRIRKDCFGLISAVYGLNVSDTLEYIDQQLNLGLGNGKPIVPIKKVVVKTTFEKKKASPILIAPRPFNLYDRDFWLPYGINRVQLTKDGVLPISTYRFTSRKGELTTISPVDVAYAYTKFQENKKKIYRPHSTDAKWLTNCTEDDVGGIDDLPQQGDYLVITKSYKDWRVLKNEGIDICIWFQNEGMIPNDEILLDLISRFKVFYIWFDNDPAGLAATKVVRETLVRLGVTKVKSVFIPMTYKPLNIKDPADLRKHSKQELQELIYKLIKN